MLKICPHCHQEIVSTLLNRNRDLWACYDPKGNQIDNCWKCGTELNPKEMSGSQS